jgi:CRP/FNR family cyclic AMP-dependent transcriptional regulator
VLDDSKGSRRALQKFNEDLEALLGRPNASVGMADKDSSDNESFDARIFFARMRGGITDAICRADELLCAQGDPADSIFFLRTGKAKVTVVSAEGKEAIVAIVGAGDFCGEESLAEQTVRTASISAMTDCDVIRIAKPTMAQLIREEPSVSQVFFKYLLKRNARLESDLVDQLFNTTERRLARLLLKLANAEEGGQPKPVVAPISQQTLADMIGTTRSRVNFFMNKFRMLGLISYNGHLHLQVHSSLLSVILCDPSENCG